MQEKQKKLYGNLLEIALGIFLDRFPSFSGAFLGALIQAVSARIEQEQVVATFEWLKKARESELTISPQSKKPKDLKELIVAYGKLHPNRYTESIEELGAGIPARYIDQDGRLIVIKHEGNKGDYLTQNNPKFPDSHRATTTTDILTAQVFKPGEWEEKTITLSDYNTYTIPLPNDGVKGVIYEFGIQSLEGPLNRQKLIICNKKDGKFDRQFDDWDHGVSELLNDLGVTK